MSFRIAFLALISVFLFSCASHQGCDTPISPSLVNSFTAKNSAQPTSFDHCNQQRAQATNKAAQFCSFENGLFAAEHGKASSQQCSDVHFDEYHDGYAMGQDISQSNKRLEHISSELENARHQLWKLTTTDEWVDQQVVISLEDQISQLDNTRRSESSYLNSLRAALLTR